MKREAPGTWTCPQESNCVTWVGKDWRGDRLKLLCMARKNYFVSSLGPCATEAFFTVSGSQDSSLIICVARPTCNTHLAKLSYCVRCVFHVCPVSTAILGKLSIFPKVHFVCIFYVTCTQMYKYEHT